MQQTKRKTRKTHTTEEPHPADFLIPTAPKKHTHQQDIPQVRLRSAGHGFYELPVVHPTQPISLHLFISFRANYPTDPSTPKSPSVDSDKRTVFLLNLPRSISPDSLARLFAETLNVSPSSIEVSIHNPHLSQHLLRPCKFNLFERDVQISNSTSSDSNQKGSKSNASHPEARGSNPNPTKKIIKLFDSTCEEGTIVSRLWSTGSIPGAYIRFETVQQIRDLMNLTDLPLRWPKKQNQDGSVGSGWMKSYETRRKMSRMTIQQAVDYADLWTKASQESRIPDLPKGVKIKEGTFEDEEQKNDDGSEDDAGWTVVKRGGHHGRSAIPTQPSPTGPTRGADPYAQSSMADRHQFAAAKVMDKKFAKNFRADAAGSKSGKRKSEHLNPDFYKSSSSMLHSNKKFRLNKIRDNFQQDIMKIQH